MTEAPAIPASVPVPAELMERALSAILGERLAGVDVEALQLVDAVKAAEMLKLTPQGFRKVAKDHIDFGERRTRWSIKQLRELVESRRVKAAKKA